MSARTPIRLVADTDDDECGFVLYDPQATMGVEQGVGDWDDKRREFAGDGRAVVHVARSLQRSPDNPGTERRIAWLSLDGSIPEELASRALCAVSGSRLQVPSGIVHFCGAFAMRSDGPPALEGERYDTAEIPRGDYRLDIYMAEWREGERERFVEERSRPSDRAMDHRLGILGFLAIALSGLAPFFLAFGHLALPLVSGARLPPHTWMWTAGLLGLLWLAVFALSRTPGQQRLIAAQNARDATELPAIVYVLTRDKLGTKPAFYHEEARESASIGRRYGLTRLRTLARGASPGFEGSSLL